MKTYGPLDDTQKKNRQYAWLLIQKVKKKQPDSTDRQAAKACEQFIHAVRKHDFWGSQATSLSFIYYRIEKLAAAIREQKRPRGKTAAFIS
ncbi:MAG: hypothetical protein O7C75_18045 [Verrucomicrobia bacterium]|nr:hypothetical protein [Verrucomicrobiota bacterium]